MCEHLNINGTNVIVCRARQKRQWCACGRPCDFLCDWKVPAKKSGTCDTPICKAHAKQVAPDKHLCPLHQRKYDEWKRRHPETTIPEQPTLFASTA